MLSNRPTSRPDRRTQANSATVVAGVCCESFNAGKHEVQTICTEICATQKLPAVLSYVYCILAVCSDARRRLASLHTHEAHVRTLLAGALLPRSRKKCANAKASPGNIATDRCRGACNLHDASISTQICTHTATADCQCDIRTGKRGSLPKSMVITHC